MKHVIEVCVLAVGLTMCGCAAPKSTSRSASSHASTNAAPQDPALRREILAMCEQDQKARKDFSPDMPQKRAIAMRELDERNTARMKEIIAKHGWPGVRLVGKDGANAAWLLVQHATHDLNFMEQCLALMSESVKDGDASATDLAYLTDRVRVHEGKPQIYGTQFKFAPNGSLIAEPIEDEANVDARRKILGLPSMAEYEKVLKEVYGKSSKPPVNNH